MDESATDMSMSGMQEASHISFLADPNVGLYFRGYAVAHERHANHRVDGW